MRVIEVSQNNCDFSYYNSISEVLKALTQENNEEIFIHIYPGTYHEKIELLKDNLTLVGMGDSPEDVVLSFDDYANAIMEDGSKRGTFRSYSMLIDADNVTLRNLTLQNSSGDENKVGQALALYADGDGLSFENCRFLSRQDTIFVGPLPQKEAIPGGFTGPKEFAPRINGHQYYKNCYICGNIDFIFGSGTAYFEGCTIESLSHGAQHEVQGYVTAPSTPEGQPFGFVFEGCDFISKECAPSTCYLGRPWREYGKSVFLNCRIGDHIKPEGFHDWNKPAAHEHSYFAVNECTRPENAGIFTPSAPFAHTVADTDLCGYTKEQVLHS